MKIKVNGNEQILDSTISIAELLQLNKVTAPEMVSVQHNGVFVEKDNYPLLAIQENDEIDFLYFMGGGIFRGRI